MAALEQSFSKFEGRSASRMGNRMRLLPRSSLASQSLGKALNASKMNVLSVQSAHKAQVSIEIGELDQVSILGEVVTETGTLQPGTLGTVVYRYNAGNVFEVEIIQPFHALLTLRENEVALLRA